MTAAQALGDQIAELTAEVRGLTKQYAAYVRRSHANQIAQWIVSLGVIIALIVGAFGLYENRQTANCINSNLGARSAPGVQQVSAALAVAEALSKSTRSQNDTSGALFILLNAPKSQQAQDYKDFLAAFANGQTVAGQTQTALDTYVAALANVKASQAAHPLGMC